MKKVILIIVLVFPFLIEVLQAGNTKQYTPFDRGIDDPHTLFIPKGTMGTGFIFSYRTYDIGNLKENGGFALFSPFVNDVVGSYNSFSISPAVSYFFKDNLSAGIKIEYDKTKLNLNKINFSIADLLSQDIKDFSLQKQSLLLSATLRNYMPIEKSKRIALFVEGRLTGGFTQGKYYKLEDGLKHGVYKDIYKAQISMVPGICVFVTNYMSFEVQIGVMGLKFEKVVQNENQVKQSSSFKSEADFHVNLFSIGFGSTFYIMDKWHRVKK